MNASVVTVPARERLRSIDEIDSAIVSLSRRLNAETYRLLVLIREFDDRLGFAKWSFPNCSEWLAWRCGLSLSAAREKIRTAHALRGLPAISEAFGSGRLTYSKVRALTRVANRRNEDLLLAYALKATSAQVEARCRQIRNVTPESVDDARRAWERRSLTILRQPEAGIMRITLEVPIDDGELFARAIDRAVEAGDGNLGPEFETSGWHAEQADAVIEIARAYLSGHGGHSSAADHYQVVVHVDASALDSGMASEARPECGDGGDSHQDGAESLRGGVARSELPIETIRRLSCDGSVVKVVEDRNGVPLDVGRKTRTVPRALKRALVARDRGCTFPGCLRTHYLDAHHIDHWSKGGETTERNLTLLCTQHHRLLHEGRFSIGRDVDGELYFARHDGRVIPRCGYRPEDCTDDHVGGHLDDRVGDGALAIGEPRGVYLIAST
jgi:hypothetical protein